jgi:hypothetical protein
MSSERRLETLHRRRTRLLSSSARITASAALPFVLASCTANFVTGDQAFVDEVASLVAAGGQCSAGGGGPTAGPLDEATRYRWTTFRGLLPEVVSPSGRVYYDELTDEPELTPQLQRMVDDIALVDPANLADGPARLAFWVNAYNALVLTYATRGYAEDAGFRVDALDFGFFRQRIHVVGGETYSLNEIEHGVIRGDEFNPDVYFLDDETKAQIFVQHGLIWGDTPLDARIHFVLNCASSSCPELPLMPLSAETLDAALNAATTDFLLDETKGAGPQGISELFDFYYDDFFAEGGAEAFIARFRSTTGVALEQRLPYDWSLNLDVRP